MTDGIAAFSLLAWLAYLASRVLKDRGLPELVAFLLVGAVLGPSGFELITDLDLQNLSFVTELALAVLMFIIGERISLRALRSAPWVGAAGLVQFVLSVTLVYFTTLQFGAERPVALLLAVLAGAGAPMTVAAVVSSVRSQSEYARGLVGAHAVSDALAALTFAAAFPIAELMVREDPVVADAVISFGRLGIGGALLGIVLGWVVARLGAQIETSGERLLFTLVHILVASTISDALELSLPLAALVMGAVAASQGSPDTSQRLFVAVRSIEQPLYLVFFGLAGASIHVSAIPELGAVGIGYVVARSVAKIAGGIVGGVIGRLPIRRGVRLGVDLLPQAGVAVGLGVLAAEQAPQFGGDVSTVILGSVVLFELVGPVVVARGLRADKGSEDGGGASEVKQDRLPTHILLAAQNRVDAPTWLFDWCERTGAELWAMGRSPEDAEDVEAIRRRAGGDNITFHWIQLSGESFTGSVVRAAQQIGADMVVVAVPPLTYGFGSRLMIHPHERIGRQLAVPVVLLPELAAEALAEPESGDAAPVAEAEPEDPTDALRSGTMAQRSHEPSPALEP